MPTVEKTITIKSKQGLHARPAAMFVQLANKYVSNVTIRKGGEEVNGKSIMGLLMIGADYGSELILIADGDDAEKMLEELEAYLVKED
ncbi:MAG: HPr family phosphocarrier protein [Candidatus Omnitrophota bacterium]